VGSSTTYTPGFYGDVTGTWKASLRVFDTWKAPSDVTASFSLYLNGRPRAIVTKLASTFTAQETLDTAGLSTVKLTGVDSTDPDSDSPLTYDWTLVSPTGSVIPFGEPAAPTPSFAPAASGTYTARLYVRDPFDAPCGITASRQIYVNLRPTAAMNVPSGTWSAGETVITSGLTLVTLKDTSQDLENLPLSYWWQVTDPSSSILALTGPTSQYPTFTPTMAGTFTIRHTVRDFYNAPAATTPTLAMFVNARPLARISRSILLSSVGETRITTGLSVVNLDGGTSTDPEDDTLTYAWRVEREDASLFSTFTALAPTFSPDARGTWTIRLAVRDVPGNAPDETDADQLLTGINGRPKAFVIDPTHTSTIAVTRPTLGLSTVYLNEDSTDPENELLTYTWWVAKPTTGILVTLSPSSGAKQPSFTPDANTTHTIKLTVNDPWQAPSPVSSTWLLYVNTRPTPAIVTPITWTANVNVGETAITTGLSTVYMTSAATDVDAGDETSLTYLWRVSATTGAPNPTVVNSASRQARFVPVTRGSHTIAHNVTDTWGAPDVVSASLRIHANARPLARIAHTVTATSPFGETRVSQNLTTVTFEPTGSDDPDSDPLTYQWSRVPLSAAREGIQSPTADYTFKPTAGGTYAIDLVARDFFNATSEATATHAMYVNYQPQSTLAGTSITYTWGVGETYPTTGLTTVTLGSDSTDPDGNTPLTYTWNVTTTGSRVLQNDTRVNPTFTASLNVSHTVSLWVADSLGAPAANTAVTKIDWNGRPRAVVAPTFTAILSSFGETAYTTGLTTFTLYNYSTDPEPDPMTYRWTVTTPSDGIDNRQISNRAAYQPTLRPSRTGTYTISLAVSDTRRAPAPTTPTISILVPNARPRAVLDTPTFTASQGETEITSGLSTVYLSSASTDPNSDTLYYRWTVTNPSSDVVRTATVSIANPRFRPIFSGTYSVTLYVTDSKKVPAPTTPSRLVYVNARPIARVTFTTDPAPVAANWDNTTVILDGSGSSDPEGSALTYSWTVYNDNDVDVSTTRLSSPTVVGPTFTTGSGANDEGAWLAELIVRDAANAPSPVGRRIILVAKNPGTEDWDTDPMANDSYATPAYVSSPKRRYYLGDIGTSGDNMYCFTPTSATLWNLDSPSANEAIYSSVAADKDRLYFSTDDSADSQNDDFFCFDSAGNEKWNVGYASSGARQARGSPALVVGTSNTVFFSNHIVANNASVQKYRDNGSSSTLLWNYEVDPGSFPTPLTVMSVNGKETCIAGRDNGHFVFLQAPASGTTAVLYWDFAPDGGDILTKARCSPAVGPDGSVYVVVLRGALAAVDADRDKVYRLDPVDKVVRNTWLAPLPGGEIYGSVAVDPSGNVYVGTAGDADGEGKLYKLSADLGTEIWATACDADVLVNTNDGFYTTPIISSDGNIYASNAEGIGARQHMGCLRASDGTVRWTYDTGHNQKETDGYISGPVMGHRGQILIWSDDKKLRSVFTDSLGVAGSGWPCFRHDPAGTGFAPLSPTE
jgi:outer membrane protein assembly factor BamB